AYLADEFADRPSEIIRMKEQAAGTVKSLAGWKFAEVVAVLENIGHAAYTRAVALSRDGTTLVSASDNGAMVVSTGDGWKESRIVAHQAMPVNVLLMLASNDKQILSGSSDRTICLRDLESGKPVAEFKGHGHWVTS